jgi:hypothetical protein
LALYTPWAKIKAVLSNRGVDTADKFETAISELKAGDTPQIYAKRTSKTMRRRSDKIEKQVSVTYVPRAMVPKKLFVCTLPESTRNYVKKHQEYSQDDTTRQRPNGRVLIA